MITRTLTRLAAVGALARGAFVTLTAAPAQAATTCAGSVVGTVVAYITTGVPVLQMKLYWDGSRNCVRINHVGASVA